MLYKVPVSKMINYLPNGIYVTRLTDLRIENYSYKCDFFKLFSFKYSINGFFIARIQNRIREMLGIELKEIKKMMNYLKGAKGHELSVKIRSYLDKINIKISNIDLAMLSIEVGGQLGINTIQNAIGCNIFLYFFLTPTETLEDENSLEKYYQISVGLFQGDPTIFSSLVLYGRNKNKLIYESMIDIKGLELVRHGITQSHVVNFETSRSFSFKKKFKELKGEFVEDNSAIKINSDNVTAYFRFISGIDSQDYLRSII